MRWLTVVVFLKGSLCFHVDSTGMCSTKKHWRYRNVSIFFFLIDRIYLITHIVHFNLLAGILFLMMGISFKAVDIDMVLTVSSY